MKKCLLITYCYSPGTSAGVQRPLKFAKYLPEFGYLPVVVTAEKTSDTDDENAIYRFPDTALELEFKGGIRGKILQTKRRLSYHCGLSNGYHYKWFDEVLVNLANLVDKEQPAIIWATYPPVEPLLLGKALSKRAKLPLVIDFRDGYVFEPFAWAMPPARYRSKLIERSLVNSADFVVAATKPVEEYFAKTYPGCRVTTITNGFDEDDWEGIEPVYLNGKINFVHTGRISAAGAGRTIKPIIEAVKKLTAAERDRIAFYLVGPYSKQEQLVLSKYPQIFKLIGPLPRTKALQYQVSTDLLLLLTGAENHSAVAGKIYEYLRSKRPIFALTGEGATRDIIQETRTGICCNPNQINQIVSGLRKVIKQYPNFDFFDPQEERILKYSRKKKAADLACLFDTLLK